MSEIDVIVAGHYDLQIQREMRRKAPVRMSVRRFRLAHVVSRRPVIMHLPLEPTEWRLSEYGEAAVIQAPRVNRVIDPLPTPPDVHLLWEPAVDQLPRTRDALVVCTEYRRDRNPLPVIDAYLHERIPGHQLVVAGDLRSMPMPTYAALAGRGVYLKHIKYAGAPDQHERLEEELRPLYRSLLGLHPPAEPTMGHPFDYESAPPRMTEFELAAFIERLKAGEFSPTE